MDDDKQKKDKKPAERGGVRRPASKPITKHPREAGDPDSPSGPDFGQSVEQGGVD
jgi:hypothetical protein